ncbi:MAG: 1-deoxy-D-xylulose-5-phosphate reductoisomerase [Muribaculaceae bacterium]|nr:1-deoxy-D-xylulose-5-phosphate reductoisomerase [Muribaculaceae bacterium]
MEKITVKNLAILGSTGSIGTQAVDIIEAFPQLFKASVLTAYSNWELLVKQSLKLNPTLVVIGRKELYPKVKEALASTTIQVEAGDEAIEAAAAHEEVEMVLTAMVGYSGLLPTINAIKAGKTIALSNKETLVVAGEIITRLARENHVSIIPVDSEHSAIFQCLVGEKRSEMRRILLTASGGPFRNLSAQEMEKVTVKQALNHPNWDMGAKVTIDSASMMNKGFEMIEAKWLFDCSPSEIQILVHPQSIVHSMVEFIDGSIKAQLGVPDMHIPIRYAFSYPNRLSAPSDYLPLDKLKELTFELPDFERFPLLRIAFEAIELGGNAPCIMNAANEIAVRDFLEGKISFTMIPKLVESTLHSEEFIPDPTISDLVESNKKARKKAEEWVNLHCQ